MQIHELKFRGKELCDAVYSGYKRFEIRYNDRNYKSGDIIKPIPLDDDLHPMEHPISDATYFITYISKGPTFGIPEGWCVFGIEEATSHNRRTYCFAKGLYAGIMLIIVIAVCLFCILH